MAQQQISLQVIKQKSNIFDSSSFEFRKSVILKTGRLLIGQNDSLNVLLLFNISPYPALATVLGPLACLAAC